MQRSVFLLYGILAYLLFFATFLYLIAFIANVPLVPRTIDGVRPGSAGEAAMADIALILAFGLQHSVMARQGFKRWWTRFVPAPVERSTYVALASVMLLLLFVLWQPLPTTVWSVEAPALRVLLWGSFAVGWATVLLSSYLISHFELFGLAQVWRNLRGTTSAEPRFYTPLLYRLVRHPLYSGFLLAFWATPDMSVGHLLFAGGMTAYILIAIRYEERDLIAHFGDDYARYRQGVGMLAPRLGRRKVAGGEIARPRG